MIESFEDLGIRPELVEALASEGIERPTELQEEVISILRSGHSLMAAAGPGAGTLVTYGVALLERLDATASGPAALVLVPTPIAADELAESLARFAVVTGHTLASLSGLWAAPTSAHILFASPALALDAVRESRLKLDAVAALVIDGAAAIRGLGGWPAVETLIGLVPSEAQRVVFTLPLDLEMEEFALRHLRKAARFPAREAEPAGAAATERIIEYVVVGSSKDEAARVVVSQAISGGAEHVLLFCRSDDRAADAGDVLALHGFATGAPGDAASPIWVSAETEPTAPALGSAPERTVRLSYDVPPDRRTLLRRHTRGGRAVVLLLPRELPHFKDIVARVGFRPLAAPGAAPPALDAQLTAFREQLRQAIQDEDLNPQILLLEPLLQEFSAAEVAAAAVALLRRRPPVPTAEAEPTGAPTPTDAKPRARPPAWTRLFFGVGQRDGVGPGDLLGAVTGETGIEGALVGKIEIRDTFSLVEVAGEVADTVIRALNGTTIRGRAVRVDYDRAERARMRSASRRAAGP
ncbi:MAG: DEAD/DEAH box helicase [Gemmatimonadetes bacterium]|nr:DEAD/DEAH box helicase [Gemmatimonadota bacterium]